MEIIQAIILGIVQGITEWLPISSEGISSIILIKYFDKSLLDAVFFSLWLHLGTLLAVTFYFWKDVKQITKTLPNYLRNPKKHGLTNFLVISTMFSAIIGGLLIYFCLGKIEFAGEKAIAVIGFLLILTGVMQMLAKKQERLHKTPTTAIAITTGIIQGFSALPGLSRSGLTTSTLLFAKYNPKQALRLSFLMSIPIVLIAQIGLSLLGKITFNLASIIGVLFSFIFGLLTLKILIKIAEKINFSYFCILLGLLSMLPLLL